CDAKTQASAALGRVPVCGVSSSPDGRRGLRRSADAGRHTRPALKKTACGACGQSQSGFYDHRVRRVRDLPAGGFRIDLELEVRRIACRRCGQVKRERLDSLADNPRYAKRFAFYVGKRCRSETIQDVADEVGLAWHTVKELEMQYLREQLRRAG